MSRPGEFANVSKEALAAEFALLRETLKADFRTIAREEIEPMKAQLHDITTAVQSLRANSDGSTNPGFFDSGYQSVAGSSDGKFTKPKREGVKHFGRDLQPLYANGEAINIWAMRNQKVEEESSEEDEDESSEEEYSEDDSPPQQSTNQAPPQTPHTNPSLQQTVQTPDEPSFTTSALSSWDDMAAALDEIAAKEDAARKRAAAMKLIVRGIIHPLTTGSSLAAPFGEPDVPIKWTPTARSTTTSTSKPTISTSTAAPTTMDAVVEPIAAPEPIAAELTTPLLSPAPIYAQRALVQDNATAPIAENPPPVLPRSTSAVPPTVKDNSTAPTAPTMPAETARNSSPGSADSIASIKLDKQYDFENGDTEMTNNAQGNDVQNDGGPLNQYIEVIREGVGAASHIYQDVPVPVESRPGEDELMSDPGDDEFEDVILGGNNNPDQFSRQEHAAEPENMITDSININILDVTSGAAEPADGIINERATEVGEDMHVESSKFAHGPEMDHGVPELSTGALPMDGRVFDEEMTEYVPLDSTWIDIHIHDELMSSDNPFSSSYGFSAADPEERMFHASEYASTQSDGLGLQAIGCASQGEPFMGVQGFNNSVRLDDFNMPAPCPPLAEDSYLFEMLPPQPAQGTFEYFNASLAEMSPEEISQTFNMQVTESAPDPLADFDFSSEELSQQEAALLSDDILGTEPAPEPTSGPKTLCTLAREMAEENKKKEAAAAATSIPADDAALDSTPTAASLAHKHPIVERPDYSRKSRRFADSASALGWDDEFDPVKPTLDTSRDVKPLPARGINARKNGGSDIKGLKDGGSEMGIFGNLLATMRAAPGTQTVAPSTAPLATTPVTNFTPATGAAAAGRFGTWNA